MEQEEHYKHLVAVINELEQRANGETSLEKMKQRAQESVANEFEKCFNALTLRKQALLSEIELKFQDDNRSMAKITATLKACQGSLTSGAEVYRFSRDSAVGMWKIAADLRFQISPCTPISVEFNTNILEAIANHGSGGESPSLEILSPNANVPPLPPRNAPTTKFTSPPNLRIDHSITPPSLPRKYSKPPASSPILNDSPQLPTATPEHHISTLAGSKRGNIDGMGENAKFSCPLSILLHPHDDCLYVSDSSNHAIRRITKQGDVSTFASADLNEPAGIAFHHQERSFFVCLSEQHSISKISSEGKTSLFAGSGSAGCADGDGINALFNSPLGIAIDQQSGTIYVADTSNHMIRKITPQGHVTTLAGSKEHGYVDGVGKAARFDTPSGICFGDKTNTLIICDLDNNRLRRLDPASGEVITMCEVQNPSDVALTPQGSLVVSSEAHSLILISQNGGKYEVKPLAGCETEGFRDGELLTCKFSYPKGVCIDPETNTCFVADSDNHKVRKFDLANFD